MLAFRFHSLSCRPNHHRQSLSRRQAPQSRIPSVYKSLDALLGAQEDPDAEAKALALASQGKQAGGLPAFGALAARGAVPKRIYTLEELRLNGIRAELLLSPKDNSLTFVRNITQARSKLHACMSIRRPRGHAVMPFRHVFIVLSLSAGSCCCRTGGSGLCVA